MYYKQFFIYNFKSQEIQIFDITNLHLGFECLLKWQNKMVYFLANVHINILLANLT